jgi:hypothetical protein
VKKPRRGLDALYSMHISDWGEQGSADADGISVRPLEILKEVLWSGLSLRKMANSGKGCAFSSGD